MNSRKTPRGIRNNNPGNIDFNKRQFDRDKWVGELGVENHTSPRFTTFSKPVYGIRALCKTLLTYHRYRKAADGSAIDTVQEVIDRWAPPIENNTNSYAAHVRDLLDVETGEEIDIEAPDTLMVLAKSIISHECSGFEYDPEILADGVQMALAKGAS